MEKSFMSGAEPDRKRSAGSDQGKEPLAGYRILVVDDEEDVQVYISTVLEDAGAEVMVAADGNQALEMARDRQPDLITLDLSMPGKDGVEAFCELRKDPQVAEIAVCIITGHPEFRQVIYNRPESPPEGYMNKPIDDKELVANLRRILGLRKRKSWRSLRFSTYDI